MLKTLTGYLNTFANTGFGCLECSPEELPGHGRTCRGSRALNPAGSSGNRAWSSAPSAAGTGALLDPAAASFCTAPTPNGQWSRKAAAGAVLGVWQRPQNPLGGFCTPRAAGSHSSLCLAAQGPPGLCPPQPCQEPPVPFPQPREEFLSVPAAVLAQLCCPGASCAHSPRKTPPSCSQSPPATRGLGSTSFPKCAGPPQRAAGKCPEQTSGRNSRVTAEKHRKQPQLPPAARAPLSLPTAGTF